MTVNLQRSNFVPNWQTYLGRQMYELRRGIRVGKTYARASIND